MISIMSSHSEPRLSEGESLDCELLYLLEQNPGLSQRELSRQLGISLGRVNYCLKALAEKGWLKLENFRRSPAKHRYIYVLTPAGISMRSALAARFLKRKLVQYEQLKEQIAMLERELPNQSENTL